MSSARLTNCLAAGSVPVSRYVNPPKLAFKQMELIELFVKKAKEFGVPDHEAFQTVDLYEDQNLHQVVICLQSLGRKVSHDCLVIRLLENFIGCSLGCLNSAWLVTGLLKS